MPVVSSQPIRTLIATDQNCRLTDPLAENQDFVTLREELRQVTIQKHQFTGGQDDMFARLELTLGLSTDPRRKRRK
jgi:hypothetical protein